jgi:hypothetical protein
MENNPNIERIKAMSFNTVTLPYNEALQNMSNQALNGLLKHMEPSNDVENTDPYIIDNLREAREETEKNFEPRGISLDADGLRDTYDVYGNLAFDEFLSFYCDVIIPFNLADGSMDGIRNNGIHIMGTILDLSTIFDPSIVKQSDFIQLIIEKVRKSEILSMELMGQIISKSQDKGSLAGSVEVYMDPEIVKHWGEIFQTYLTEDEQRRFKIGKAINANGSKKKRSNSTNQSWN